MIPLVLSIHMFNYVFPLYMMEPVFGSFNKYPSIQALEINGVLLKKHFIGYFLWRIINDMILILITLIHPDTPVFCLIFVKHQVYSNGTWEQITKDLATIKSIKFEYLHQYYALILNFRMYKRRNSFISWNNITAS